MMDEENVIYADINSSSEKRDVIGERCEGHFRRAEIILKYGKNTDTELQHVVKEVHAAIALKPQASHYMLLVEAYIRALDVSSAIFSLRYVMSMKSDYLRARNILFDMLVMNGLEAFRQGRNYVMACYRFGEALKVESSRPKIWTFKAICHVYLQDYKEALEATNRAVHTSSSPSAELHILRAKILWAMGLMDQGNKDLKAAATIDEKHPEVLAFTARSFMQSERLYKTGIQNFNQSKFDEALTNIQHAIYITPSDIKLYIMLSKIHRMQNEYELAFQDLQQCSKIFKEGKKFGVSNWQPIEITKQFNLVCNEMAMKLASNGNYDKAIALYNKAIETELAIHASDGEKIDYRFYVNRGDCYRAKQMGEEAIVDYRSALALDPNNWEVKVRLSMAFYMIGSNLFNQSKYKQSERYLDDAIYANPKISEYYAVRGRARYYQGDYSGACTDYKRALELNPGNEEIAARLKQFYTETGMNESDAAVAKASGVQPVLKPIPLLRGGPEPVVPSPKDVQDMMLHPHRARNPPGLPGMRNYLKTRIRPSTKLFQSASSPALATHRDVLGQPTTYCSSLLPKVNPNMLGAIAAAVIAENSRKVVNDIMQTHVDNSKDTVWTVIDTVKEISIQNANNRKLKALAEHRKTTKKMATSSAALKRESQARALIAVKTAVVSGIVTRRKDVEELAEAEGKMRPPRRRVRSLIPPLDTSAASSRMEGGGGADPENEKYVIRTLTLRETEYSRRSTPLGSPKALQTIK